MSKGQKVRRHHGSGNTALRTGRAEDHSISAQTGIGKDGNKDSRKDGGKDKEGSGRGPGFWFAIFAILTVIAALYSGSMRIFIPVAVFTVLATALFEMNISRYKAAKAAMTSGVELIIIGLVGTIAITGSGTPSDGSVMQLVMFVFEFWLLFGVAELAVGGLIHFIKR